MWAQGRWHYVAAVIDLFARRVVGWAFSTKSDADLIIKALNMAYELHGRPQDVLFHSDQGSEYGSRNFRQRLWRYLASALVRQHNSGLRCPQTTRDTAAR